MTTQQVLTITRSRHGYIFEFAGTLEEIRAQLINWYERYTPDTDLWSDYAAQIQAVNPIDDDDEDDPAPAPEAPTKEILERMAGVIFDTPHATIREVETIPARDIALKLTGKLDITEDAAEQTIEEYARQIEDMDGITIDTDALTPGIADTLYGAVVSAARAGDLGGDWEEDLQEVTAKIDDLEGELAYEKNYREKLILEALGAGAPVGGIAKVTGLTRQWIYKLRERI